MTLKTFFDSDEKAKHSVEFTQGKHTMNSTNGVPVHLAKFNAPIRWYRRKIKKEFRSPIKIESMAIILRSKWNILNSSLNLHGNKRATVVAIKIHDPTYLIFFSQSIQFRLSSRSTACTSLIFHTRIGLVLNIIKKCAHKQLWLVDRHSSESETKTIANNEII